MSSISPASAKKRKKGGTGLLGCSLQSRDTAASFRLQPSFTWINDVHEFITRAQVGRR